MKFWTGTRVPVNTGVPPMISGSEWITSRGLSTAPCYAAKSNIGVLLARRELFASSEASSWGLGANSTRSPGHEPTHGDSAPRRRAESPWWAGTAERSSGAEREEQQD